MKVKSLVLAIPAVFLLGACTGPQNAIRQRNVSPAPAASAVLAEAAQAARGSGAVAPDAELLGSISAAQLAAGDLAAAAMELDQALGGRAASAYAKAFAGFAPPVIRSLASAQARAGDPAGAIAWARRLPSPPARAAALLGLAEGMIATAK
jgi:hypothetical protein